MRPTERFVAMRLAARYPATPLGLVALLSDPDFRAHFPSAHAIAQGVIALDDGKVVDVLSTYPRSRAKARRDARWYIREEVRRRRMEARS